jgi:hypothetical protein
MFLKSSWAFECIRTQSLAVFETHAHPFVSWEKLYPAESGTTDQQPLLVKETRTGGETNDVPSPVTNDLTKVHDLTASPKSRKVKRSRPYDGDKDSQERETSVPLFSPTKVLIDSHSLLTSPQPGLAFACMRSGKKSSGPSAGAKSSHENKNKHITSVLDQLQEIYEVASISPSSSHCECRR